MYILDNDDIVDKYYDDLETNFFNYLVVSIILLLLLFFLIR